MDHVSRRSMLRAAAALPALAIPKTVAATHHPIAKRAADSRASANAKFWVLCAELASLEAAWSACPDDDEVSEQRLSKQIYAKLDEALMQGVFCPRAVLEKLKLVHFDAGGVALPEPAKNLSQMIEWDLERCQEALLAIHPS